MYGAVPSDADTVTVVVVCPQAITPAIEEATNVRFTMPDTTRVQPLASVTVKLNNPAGREKAPVPLYGAVPPVAETVTVALLPSHGIGLITNEATKAVG